MKKIVVILFSVAIATVNAVAQEPAPMKEKKTPEQRAENMTKRLTRELELNAEQQVKAKAVILKREQQREKIMAEMKAQQEKAEAEFKEFLSSEQYQKLKKKEQEHRQRMHEMREKGARKEKAPKDAPVPPPAPEGK